MKPTPMRPRLHCCKRQRNTNIQNNTQNGREKNFRERETKMATLFLILVAVFIGLFAFKVYTISELKQLTMGEAMEEVKKDFRAKIDAIKKLVTSKADSIK